MDRVRSWWPFPLLCMSPIWYSIQIRYFICFTYRVTLLYPRLHVHCSVALSLPFCGCRWQPLLNSTLGSLQTCTLVGHVLVVPVGFGWPGGLPDVLRLHVPHVRVAGEHAHFGLAVQSRSIGVCRRGCPGPDRVMDRAQPVFCLCVITIYLHCIYLHP